MPSVKISPEFEEYLESMLLLHIPAKYLMRQKKVVSSGVTRRQIDYFVSKKYGRTWDEEIKARQDRITREQVGFFVKKVMPKDYHERITAGFSMFIVQEGKGRRYKSIDYLYEEDMYDSPATFEDEPHEDMPTGRTDHVGSAPVLKGYMATEPDQPLHIYECNIPYAPLNPVKRISLSARGLNTSGLLIDPDKPLYFINKTDDSWHNISIGARYADYHTINAKMVLAEDEYDREITVDDAVIISKSLQQRLSYDYLAAERTPDQDEDVRPEKRVFTVHLITRKGKPVPLEEGYYSKGEPLQLMRVGEYEGIVSKMPVAGELSLLGEPEKRGKKHIYYTQQFKIHVRGVIDVGDKLLGLTGLRGVVAEVRDKLPDNADIMVHPSKVWGLKESRKCGAWVRELLENNNYIAIYYQPEHIARNEASMREVSISTTLWSVLATHGGVVTQKILPSQRFADICYMLRMELDPDGRLVPVDIPMRSRRGGQIIKARVAFFENQTRDNVWLPNWLKLDFMQDTRWHITKLGKLFKETNKEGLDDYALDHYEYEISKELVKTIRSKKLFETLIKGSRYNFVCIPFIQPEKLKHKTNTVYIAPNQGFEDGQRVLVVREPVISKTNVLDKFITLDSSLPENVVAIDSESIHMMYGDYDGDRLWILPIDDPSFEVLPRDYPEPDQKRIEEVNLEIDVAKINKELKVPSVEESMVKAEEYHDELHHEKVYLAGFIGGARKNCDLEVNDLDNTRNFTLPNAELLEGAIKDRPEITKQEAEIFDTPNEFVAECRRRRKEISEERKNSVITVLYSRYWDNVRHLADKQTLFPNGLYNEFFRYVVGFERWQHEP